ncbi:hypothetical protein HG531_011040 [Fusarium graminearum]|nr:hypothetical protein HG531_011040 [Fusarium graminearum]
MSKKVHPVGHRGVGRDLDHLGLGHRGHGIHVHVHHGLVRRCYSAGCRAEGSGSASCPGLAEADQPAASAEAAGIAVAAGETADPEQQVVGPLGEALVDAGGDGLNFGAEVSLNVVKVEAIVPVDQVNSQTKVTVTAGSTDTVEVSLGVLGEIKVDDNVDGLNVDTTGEQIGAHKVSADTVTEIVENTVSCMLLHLRMTVETRVAKLGDFLGQKFDSVDFIWADHVLVGEVLHGQREGGGEEHNLSVLGVELQELLNDRGELNGQKLIGLVHDEHGAFAKVGNILASEIENSARGTNHNMNGILKANNIISKTSTTGRDHDIDTEVLTKSFADLRGLHGKLTCGDENKTLDLRNLGVDAFQGGDDKGGCLASAVLCTGKNVSAS